MASRALPQARARMPARPAPGRSQPSARAIVVGIGHYPRYGAGGTAENDLKGPELDATMMAEWLVEQEKAHVTLITSSGRSGQRGSRNKKWKVTDMRPRLEDVQAPLNGFMVDSIDAVQKGGKSRLANRLYVYMAGHGYMPEPNHLALVTTESINPGFIQSIQATSWVDWFAEQHHFDEIVLWMDCCAERNYLQPSSKPLQPATPARQGRAKMFVAFAAKPSLQAYEAPIDPDGPVRGIFTARLLDALAGAATDETGMVTSTSIIGHLSGEGLVGEEAVESTAGTAHAEHYFPGRDLIVFGPGKLPKYVLKVPLADGAKVKITRGPVLPVATRVVAGGAVKVGLGTGYYKAEAPGFSRLFEIAAGSATDVDLS
ncbi:MAG TPA: hypothetical protein VGW40_04210 [Allosphingosinicella sp.]|nr:hypothetical protein [Allosphingosinicella sp.]